MYANWGARCVSGPRGRIIRRPGNTLSSFEEPLRPPVLHTNFKNKTSIRGSGAVKCRKSLRWINPQVSPSQNPLPEDFILLHQCFYCFGTACPFVITWTRTSRFSFRLICLECVLSAGSYIPSGRCLPLQRM
jgi:hypothetical protein